MRATLLTIALLATAVSAEQECAKGLHMIVARGTGETVAAEPGVHPKNTGVTGELTNMIANRIPHSTVAGVEYPAKLANPAYNVSEGKGAQAMLDMARDYHSACPDSKIALFGYSQGAHIVADVLCGGMGAPFNDDPPLASDIVKNNVVAAIMLGDPTHIANTSYDRGTSLHDGIFPRENLTACMPYADRMISWCDAGDVFCDTGNDEEVHLVYIKKYNSTLTDFVVARWENSTASSTNTTTSTTTTSSVPSSTSSPTNAPADGAATSLSSRQSGLLGWCLMLMAAGIFID